MKIEKPDKNSYNRLIEIWESAVKATHDFLSAEYFEYIKSRLPLYFEHVALYSYTDDNVIKGFLGVSESAIEMLFIDDKYRGSGIGKSLLKFAVEDLKLSRVDVNEQNTRAVGFYKHFGFKETGRSEHDSEGRNYPIIHLQI